jgi:hypothetical protein
MRSDSLSQSSKRLLECWSHSFRAVRLDCEPRMVSMCLGGKGRVEEVPETENSEDLLALHASG